MSAASDETHGASPPEGEVVGGPDMTTEEQAELLAEISKINDQDKKDNRMLIGVTLLFATPLALVLMVKQGFNAFFVVCLVVCSLVVCVFEHRKSQRMTSINEVTNFIIRRYFADPLQAALFFGIIKAQVKVTWDKKEFGPLFRLIGQIRARIQAGETPRQEEQPMSPEAWARCIVSEYTGTITSRNSTVSRKGDLESFHGSAPLAGEQDVEVAACAICLCEYELGEKICNLPCGHIFHLDCIETWGKEHSRCPLCNQNPENAETSNLHGILTRVLHASADSISKSVNRLSEMAASSLNSLRRIEASGPVDGDQPPSPSQRSDNRYLQTSTPHVRSPREESHQQSSPSQSIAITASNDERKEEPVLQGSAV